MPKPKPIVPPPPPTFWELLDEDILELEARPDFNREDVVYPKKPKPSRMVDPYDLPKLRTKTLLSYLDAARASGNGEYNPRSWAHNSRAISIEDIKAELAKREHVHNKQSGSEARRKAAQQNHGSKAPKKKRPRTKKQREARKWEHR